ncbi:TlpA disulfide reductase family protein [Bacteroides sp. 224]|uniref:TlpA disulfide reductase family protein n=1 Tax=Bacteroides sp. 224 TaxID=2302936 RepID=UPI0013D5CC4A|nr:TlpA disulfide reductase family protein [Bacteroides sp. 224]NDV66826.1 AhpC/TSA family protein [Bacteroides sp. 224]
MKKLFCLFTVAAVGLASCGGGNGYTITGTVEGAADGDTVYVMKPRQGGDPEKLNMAIISKGKFTFKGTQDSTVNLYIVYEDEVAPAFADFFLENGKINATLKPDASTVTGTPLNDAYQVFKDEMAIVVGKQREVYGALVQSELAEEERAAKMIEMQSLQAEMINVVKEQVELNITSPLSVYLLEQFGGYIDHSELGDLLDKMPAELQNKESIATLKESVTKANATKEGNQFVDLDMLTPNGDPIKLSDYAGKGKIVLVDFWASWCGPCRREMPKLVDAYAKYKNKGFEIVGVSLDRDGEAWKKGIADLNITWPQMSDLKYWQSEAVKEYVIRGIPHLMLLDGEGTILARGLSGDEVQEKLAELLK